VWLFLSPTCLRIALDLRVEAKRSMEFPFIYTVIRHTFSPLATQPVIDINSRVKVPKDTLELFPLRLQVRSHALTDLLAKTDEPKSKKNRVKEIRKTRKRGEMGENHLITTNPSKLTVI
jgi:hypothetical protein